MWSSVRKFPNCSPMKTNQTRRRTTGLSLLELVITMAMTAALTTASITLLRTSQTAWNRHHNDQQRRQNAAAVLRHMVRRVRQATAVTAITAATDASGSLSTMRVDGTTLVWDHDNVGNQVMYGETTATSLLARDVTAMTFVGYKVDGVTQTVDTALIHSVRCTVAYSVERPTGPATEQISCVAWLRSW